MRSLLVVRSNFYHATLPEQFSIAGICSSRRRRGATFQLADRLQIFLIDVARRYSMAIVRDAAAISSARFISPASAWRQAATAFVLEFCGERIATGIAHVDRLGVAGHVVVADRRRDNKVVTGEQFGDQFIGQAPCERSSLACYPLPTPASMCQADEVAVRVQGCGRFGSGSCSAW
jgi:hypothetical protein